MRDRQCRTAGLASRPLGRSLTMASARTTARARTVRTTRSANGPRTLNCCRLGFSGCRHTGPLACIAWQLSRKLGFQSRFCHARSGLELWHCSTGRNGCSWCESGLSLDVVLPTVNAANTDALGSQLSGQDAEEEALFLGRRRRLVSIMSSRSARTCAQDDLPEVKPGLLQPDQHPIDPSPRPV